MKSTPCISYRYTSIIASKLFDYKQSLQCIDLEQLRRNPPKCSFSSSPFNYSPTGDIITGDVNIVQIQNSEVNIVWNVIIIQRANTKSSVRQHGPPTNAKVASGAMEE
jgi:hypothetical protein